MATIDPTKAKAKTTYKHASTFYALVADSPNGRLHGGSNHYPIYVLDQAAAKKEPVASWNKHDNYVSALVFIRRDSGPLVVSGSYDRHLIWWESSSGQVIRSIEA